jgi:hypothetical protein
MLPLRERLLKMKSHQPIYIAFDPDSDMPIENVCQLMQDNGFHVHVSREEADQCEKERED